MCPRRPRHWLQTSILYIRTNILCRERFLEKSCPLCKSRIAGKNPGAISISTWNFSSARRLLWRRRSALIEPSKARPSRAQAALPGQNGALQKPTVINNVETFATCHRSGAGSSGSNPRGEWLRGLKFVGVSGQVEHAASSNRWDLHERSDLATPVEFAAEKIE